MGTLLERSSREDGISDLILSKQDVVQIEISDSGVQIQDISSVIESLHLDNS